MRQTEPTNKARTIEKLTHTCSAIICPTVSVCERARALNAYRSVTFVDMVAKGATGAAVYE